MRTTVEITDEQRACLLQMAASRGLKGFSALVQEAIDLLIRQEEARAQAIEAALSQKGRLSARDATEMEETVLQLRSRWR